MQPSTEPKSYRCNRASHTVQITGRGNDPAWASAPWTDYFLDIEGNQKPQPRFRTRAKMLWDDQYFYVYAEMEEPHVWGTLTQKNAVIFHDNDFEVFIDPDGDGDNYYEFEINALNTIWELTMVKRYTHGGPAIHGTNLSGLISAVHIDGTLNDPTDEDRGWSVEIAFPFAELTKFHNAGKSPPKPGDRWRVNFSRVEWKHTIVEGKYVKVPKQPEDNWVWSPQGLIDMHQPEHWGFVEFLG
jgi:hypothetical protein